MFLRADVAKTIDHVAYWRLTFTDCNQTHFCCQFWLHSLYSWWLWWFFSAVSMGFSFKEDNDTHNLVWVGEKNKTQSKQNKQQQLYALLNTDAVQSRTKVEQGKSFSTAALSKQKWNSPVAILQSALILLNLSIWGGGRWGWGVSLLACDTCGCWRGWVFMVLLADQHQKRSCLAGASTCFWTQCTEYLQQVTQSAQFQPVLGTSNFTFHRCWGNIYQ